MWNIYKKEDKLHVPINNAYNCLDLGLWEIS